MVNRFPLLAPAKAALRALADLPTPACCLFCGAHNRFQATICSDCYRDLPWLEPGCQRCARPLATSEDTPFCGQCLATPPPFSVSVCCWHYRPPVASAIAGFKYRRRRAHGRTLALAMHERLVSAYFEEPWPDRVTAIPLHWRRQFRRGFNQSEELAATVAGELGLRYRPLLQRVRATPPQQSLDARQRRRNLRGAFRCRERLDGLSIALVDDVITTGSTATEAAHTLLRAGAAAVHVWALARAGE